MDIDFSTMHGCACGRPGQQVARRNVKLITREWEVDVRHSDGTVHSNRVVLNERPTMVEDSK